jgi:hypothetical protein
MRKPLRPWRTVSKNALCRPVSQSAKNLKTITQKVRESLEEFARAIEQLAHSAYSTLTEDHIRRGAGKAFADSVEDPTIKIQLLLGGEQMVNEDLRQGLELQAVLLASRPHKMSARKFLGSRSPPTR